MYVGVDTNYKGKILQVATAIDGTERGTFDDTIVPQEAVSVSITPRSNNSLMLITALNPKIGYEKSAEIAKKAFKEKITLRESTIKLGYLDEREFDSLVDPKKMVK